jgi:hypothetical protein
LTVPPSMDQIALAAASVYSIKTEAWVTLLPIKVVLFNTEQSLQGHVQLHLKNWFLVEFPWSRAGLSLWRVRNQCGQLTRNHSGVEWGSWPVQGICDSKQRPLWGILVGESLKRICEMSNNLVVILQSAPGCSVGGWDIRDNVVMTPLLSEATS